MKQKSIELAFYLVMSSTMTSESYSASCLTKKKWKKWTFKSDADDENENLGKIF